MENKNLKINFIFLILLIIFCTGCGNIMKFKKDKPDMNKVNATVEKLKNDELVKAKFNNYIRDLFRRSAAFLGSKKNLIIIMSIACGIILLSVILFFVLRYVFSVKYSAKKNIELKKEFNEFVFDKEYFKKLSDEKKYSEAVLYLHRYSIFYLIQNKIAYRKNMTNNEFYKKINNPEIAGIFRKIYLVSEKILFDNYEAGESDYEYCSNGFFTVFQ
jgi:hypothetical protein